MRHHLPPELWAKLFLALQQHDVEAEPVRRALDLPSSTFYRKLAQHRQGGVQPRKSGSGQQRLVQPQDLEPAVREALRELPPVAGHRRIQRRLARKGVVLSQSSAYRVTRDLGLTVPRKQGKRRRYERIRVEGPGLAWVVDTTEWHLGSEKVFVYLAIDAHSRYCPGVMASLTEDAAMTTRFYEQIFQEGVPVVVHTDPGSEFDNGQAKAYLAVRSVQWKPGPPQTPKAQAFVERFVLTLKEEWLSWKDPRSFHELQDLLEKFRSWYNDEREHSSLDYRFPGVVHRAA